ncbi:MAG: hypothetical protein ACPG0L_05120 [Bacteroidia bacterium]|nr:hypothetical protein [Bacteroidia bacterium]MDA9213708.1 hypothetical protein [Bacteroidia bacterium]
MERKFIAAKVRSNVRRGVPLFIFDGQYSLSGAHGEDVIYKVMDTVKMKTP